MRSWLLSLSLLAILLGGCCGTRRCNPCDQPRIVPPCYEDTVCASGYHWNEACITYNGASHTRVEALDYILSLATSTSDPEQALVRQLAGRIKMLTNATDKKEMSTGDPVTCNSAAIQAAVAAAKMGNWHLTIDKLAQGH